jgi:hypothetical protein
LTVRADAIPHKTVQKHDPLSVTHFGIKFSPHRSFYRCKQAVAFIIVFVATHRSLFVTAVIEASVIAPVIAAK